MQGSPEIDVSHSVRIALTCVDEDFTGFHSAKPTAHTCVSVV